MNNRCACGKVELGSLNWIRDEQFHSRRSCSLPESSNECDECLDLRVENARLQETPKAKAIDEIVRVLWAQDHLEQIALALDLTNDVLSRVVYEDNPDLTKRVNEFAGGTDMQDDLRAIAKILKPFLTANDAEEQGELSASAPDEAVPA
jgi:hypothetical protein